MQTISAKIHGYGSSLGFMALLATPLILAILSFRQGSIQGMVLCSLFFALALAAFVLFVMADKPAFQNTFVAQEGTWQRLTLLFMYCPLALAAVRLL